MLRVFVDVVALPVDMLVVLVPVAELFVDEEKLWEIFTIKHPDAPIQHEELGWRRFGEVL